MDSPIHVVVDRQRWYRGQGTDTSFLLTIDGQMCCVGFLCKVWGLSDPQIKHVPTIAEIQQEEFHAPFPENWLHDENETPDFSDLYIINDDPQQSDDDREATLIAQGAKLGIAFTFVN